jgi:glycerophosphoryl diester phosphodiesterase
LPDNKFESTKLKFPIIFAHRGANSFAPENSIPAFEKALDLGCDGVELDVRLCGSGEVVVFHDRFTHRLTGYHGNIQKLRYQKIKKLSLGALQEKIPTLDEVLELLHRKVLINIDVKKDLFSKNDFEERIIRILKKHNLKNNIIISSFNPRVLKKISVLFPGLPSGYIFRNKSSMVLLNGHPVNSLHARYQILDKKYISNLTHRANDIYAWTVDEVKSMLEQIQNGIHGIISNRPELFLQMKEKILNEKISINQLVAEYT